MIVLCARLPSSLSPAPALQSVPLSVGPPSPSSLLLLIGGVVACSWSLCFRYVCTSHHRSFITSSAARGRRLTTTSQGEPTGKKRSSMDRAGASSLSFSLLSSVQWIMQKIKFAGGARESEEGDASHAHSQLSRPSGSDERPSGFGVEAPFLCCCFKPPRPPSLVYLVLQQRNENRHRREQTTPKTRLRLTPTDRRSTIQPPPKSLHAPNGTRHTHTTKRTDDSTRKPTQPNRTKPHKRRNSTPHA